MFDDLSGLFYENVEPAYRSYAEVRESGKAGRNKLLRAAVEVTTALFHFREHLPGHLARTRSQAVLECADYRLIADVTNVTKHKELTRSTSEGAPLVRSADAVHELIVITRYEDESGEYSDVRAQVVVDCEDGTTRNLDSAIVTVLNYWGGILRAAGVAPYVPRSPAEEPGSRFVARADARPLDFEILQGLRFASHMQFRRFDVLEGRSSPVDLTGADISFKIYKPSYVFQITATPSAGGPSFTCSLELTEEQSLAFHQLKTDSERTEFLKAIANERQAEISSKLRSAAQDAGKPVG
ncbi:hypothetical protein [Bradyrhizobium sp. NC92]|uniref:hypothetical protein n=1 Tax=Bradyrhizobium sp. (strain NC92) TaxID=55395 RepID=UPI0021AAD05D|nr:hypothetical protein [Bradyrhizobium sp. NC92]UWU69139.1 hypothetical protein N2602_00990 [Bradyrhizobium sp. NC92]